MFGRHHISVGSWRGLHLGPGISGRRYTSRIIAFDVPFGPERLRPPNISIGTPSAVLSPGEAPSAHFGPGRIEQKSDADAVTSGSMPTFSLVKIRSFLDASHLKEPR